MGLPKRSFAALHGAGYAVGQPGGAQDPCGGLYCRSQPSLIRVPSAPNSYLSGAHTLLMVLMGGQPWITLSSKTCWTRTWLIFSSACSLWTKCSEQIPSFWPSHTSSQATIPCSSVNFKKLGHGSQMLTGWDEIDQFRALTFFYLLDRFDGPTGSKCEMPKMWN